MVAAGWEGDHIAHGTPELRGAADAGASPAPGEGSTNLLTAPLTGVGQPAKTLGTYHHMLCHGPGSTWYLGP